MRVADLTGLPGLRLLAGSGRLEAQVRRVYTTDLPDPARYLSGGELVLTGLIWCREPGDAQRFAAAVAGAGAVALGAGEALGEIPRELVSACERLGLPLFAVPQEISFGTVTDEIMRRLSGDRAGEMTRLLGRRRLLLSAVTQGAGLDALFSVAADDVTPGCWLLTAAGRLLAGTGGSLARPLAISLAAGYLTADRFPAVLRAEGQRYSLLQAGGKAGLAGWFLACAGDITRWPEEARESVTELAADVALERARVDSGLRGERRLGEQIVGRLAAGSAGLAEIIALMRAAELPPDGCYLAVAATIEVPGLPDAELGPGLVGELALARAGRAAIAQDGSETLALIPQQDDGHGQPAAGSTAGGGIAAQVREAESAAVSSAGGGIAARVREAEPALLAGLRGGRLAIGVSGICRGAGGLAGALREARGARRLAGLKPGGVCLVTGDEVGTHAMLLASVPADVLRSFRERLLGPLLRYDRLRRAELTSTLTEFLACSGSWNACAARLHVHVNTLRYRIRRIEELTGRDLSRLDHRVDFFLALAGRDASGAPAASSSPAVSGQAGSTARIP